jgi:uncharacterized protein (TIGR03118 family)
MLKHIHVRPLATAACTIALALAPTLLHADTFTQVNLVSNVPGLAAVTDPNLVNPWGLANSATSPFWVSNQGTGTATLYTGTGTPQALVVSIPGSGMGPTGPTGQVFNSGPATGFLVNGAKATFIFDTLNGTIAAWNAGAGTVAQIEVNSPGAIFTGLTQATVAGNSYLYAANSTGNIQIFDSSWHDTTNTGIFFGKFADPSGKTGFVPFNIQQIGVNLYVTYAQLGPGGVPMPGGYVVEYDANGNFIKEITTGPLSAPWGITIAPSGFGAFSNDLLVGNFGSGTILAYDPNTDAYLGTLTDLNGQPIVNDHLWALETRTGGTGVNTSGVYFTAGIHGEEDGLFGVITEVPEPATILGTATGLLAFVTMKIRSRRP